VSWQRRHGRHDLPWQANGDPYRIWVSEIMLQQTQVATASAYFERFVARFPDVAALAAAPVDDVMRLWSGLGYYARARNLHRAAQAVVERHGGLFPLSIEEAVALPGVGRSTAAAIVALSTGEPHAILDGNVKRVLARQFGVEGEVDSPAVLSRLWALADSLVPRKAVQAYTQGLMDLGATVCTRAKPACAGCPVRASCIALRDGRIATLPGRKATRATPARKVAMLAIVSRGAVLVEKRPPSGIWGGLWSLPEAPDGADPAAWVAKRFGLRIRLVEALAPFTHAFTHFSLGVTPWIVRTERGRPTGTDAQTQWLDIGTAHAAALPAPVKKLLSRLPAGGARKGARARPGSGAGSPGGRRDR